MWRISSRRLVVHSTASRAVALRAMSEMQRALPDLERVFGATPEGPIPDAVMRDEEQYDRFVFGDPDGRRPPTHVARMHVIHRAYFAESWFEPVDGDNEYRGMGVCCWDTFALYGDRYGVHAARMAVGLSSVDALDPSPKAVPSARKNGLSPDSFADFRAEKTLPAGSRSSKRSRLSSRAGSRLLLKPSRALATGRHLALGPAIGAWGVPPARPTALLPESAAAGPMAQWYRGERTSRPSS